MTVDQVIALLRQEIARAGSQANWAAQNAVTAAYVSDVLGKRREPGPAILKALGLERVTTYRRYKNDG